MVVRLDNEKLYGIDRSHFNFQHIAILIVFSLHLVTAFIFMTDCFLELLFFVEVVCIEGIQKFLASALYDTSLSTQIQLEQCGCGMFYHETILLKFTSSLKKLHCLKSNKCNNWLK